MGDKSSIEWTDASWNPTTGCDRVSPGCAKCYALTLSPRLKAMALALGKHVEPTDPYMRDGDPKTSGPGFGLMLHPDRLMIPLNWQRPRRIFVNSMSDLFHPEVPDHFIDDVFAVMAVATQHTFQVLTKRPERMRAYLASRSERPEDTIGHAGYHLDGRLWLAGKRSSGLGQLQDHTPWPLPNLWVGTSVENARWRTRIDELRNVPAAVRFLSCEPLLGPLVPETAGDGTDDLDLTGIDWVIIGGESGPGARPMDPDWARLIVGSCRQQGVAPFVKQLGRVWSVEHVGTPGHGGDAAQWPEDLRVREWPTM